MIDTLCELALEGGRIALRHHGRLEEVMTKADESPLTIADLEVDQCLCDGLERAFPDIPVVTEERAESHAPGFVGARFFLVDPIDGTKEFVKNRGEFTVNIALIENGIPVAGVVCAPAVGRLFAGTVGEGAFETPLDGGARSALVPRQPDNDALIVVGSRSHLTPETQAFVDANPVASFTSAGSSLKFCLLAAGEADLYPRYGPTMEWDTAAGHAVLSSVGGTVEQISGEELNYGKPGYRNPFFVAYTPGTKFTRVPATDAAT